MSTQRPDAGGIEPSLVVVWPALAFFLLLVVVKGPTPQPALPSPVREHTEQVGTPGASSSVKQLQRLWPPLLTEHEARRGIAYFGSGDRLRRVAQKLLAGQPIVAAAVGGSVTAGAWVKETENVPALFFSMINASFPHG